MSSTQPCVKEDIFKGFTSLASPLRIVISTIALGMGVDTPDVRHIIHFGPMHNLVDYIQGVGREASLHSTLRSPFEVLQPQPRQKTSDSILSRHREAVR